MRQSYVTPGVDESALVRYAKQRVGETTTIHKHPRDLGCICGVAEVWLPVHCEFYKCYVVQGVTSESA